MNPATLALLTATFTWILTVLRTDACRPRAGHQVHQYASFCYTDIPLLFTDRGLVDGKVPYLSDVVFEYPVLTGWLVDMFRRLNVLFGAPVGPNLTDEQTTAATSSFFLINMVGLFVFFLLAVAAMVWTSRGRKWDAMMLAASPTVLMTGLINWDMLPVALACLALMFWSRKQMVSSGFLMGLAVAAKLYPVVFLVPIIVLCVRSKKVKDLLTFLGSFVLAWVAANLPVMVASGSGWAAFWTFNADRGADLGSIWYILSLVGHPVHGLNLTVEIWLVLGALGVVALGALAPQRPRLGQLLLLMLAVFLLTNKVYSPQYCLWLLPVIIMARPRWADWLAFTVAECAYTFAVWGHLGQFMVSNGGPDRVYWLAVIARMAVLIWICARVVRDILQPSADPVRREIPMLKGGPAYVDDPAGGILDGAEDGRWATAVRERINGALSGVRPILPTRTTGGTPLPGIRTAVDRSDEAGLRWVAGTWLVSRLSLIVMAFVVMAVSNRSLHATIGNWDVEHFVGIATDGYVTEGDNAKRMAFFPGLPLLLRLFVLVGASPEIGGIVVSLLASVAAAWALYRMGGTWAAALWLIAPTAVFTVMPYTEALFCALAFWAWERARRDQWWQAGLLAAGASAIRVSGLFLVGALGIMILTWRFDDGTTAGERVLGWLKRVVWLLLPVAVIGLYAVYLHSLTGSWTAWYSAQEAGWVRQWTLPWDSVANTFPPAAPGGYADKPGWAWVFRFELVSFAVGLAATGYLLKRKMWAEASWIGVQVLAFSTSYWLFSVNRAVLLWFPVWIILAELIAWKPASRRGLIVHRTLHIGYVIVSLIVMVWWSWMFYNGQWAS